MSEIFLRQDDKTEIYHDVSITTKQRLYLLCKLGEGCHGFIDLRSTEVYIISFLPSYLKWIKTLTVEQD